MRLIDQLVYMFLHDRRHPQIGKASERDIVLENAYNRLFAIVGGKCRYTEIVILTSPVVAYATILRRAFLGGLDMYIGCAFFDCFTQ